MKLKIICNGEERVVVDLTTLEEVKDNLMRFMEFKNRNSCSFELDGEARIHEKKVEVDKLTCLFG
jgi:hypothetical protein